MWSTTSHAKPIKYYGSFTHGCEIWILYKYYEEGSLKDFIEYEFPKGIKNEDRIDRVHGNIRSSSTYLSSPGAIGINHLNFV